MESVQKESNKYSFTMKSNGEYGVYVGTYGKYNSGNLNGAWLYLEDYIDKEEFMGACFDLHKDETDPEIMFQDIDGVPEFFYGECSINESFWEWMELEDYEKELIEAYLDHNGGDYEDCTLENAQESLLGIGDSLENVVSDWCEECGMLENVPNDLAYCIDWEHYARDRFSQSHHAGQVYVWS